MTVKELKEHLENVSDSLEVIIEMIVIENGEIVDRDESVDHIETNDKEFYLVSTKYPIDIEADEEGLE